jgi:hypothetical protein
MKEPYLLSKELVHSHRDRRGSRPRSKWMSIFGGNGMINLPSLLNP